jgi:DNA-binding transcriptional ArsR family regulator
MSGPSHHNCLTASTLPWKERMDLVSRHERGLSRERFWYSWLAPTSTSSNRINGTRTGTNMQVPVQSSIRRPGTGTSTACYHRWKRRHGPASIDGEGSPRLPQPVSDAGTSTAPSTGIGDLVVVFAAPTGGNELGYACRDLLEFLHAQAVTQADGRRVVWLGSSQIAERTGKSAGTITQQIGQLRAAGLVAASRRGRVELTPNQNDPTLRASTVSASQTSACNLETIGRLALLAEQCPSEREGLARAIAAIANEIANTNGQPRSDREIFRDSTICREVHLDRKRDLLSSKTTSIANSANRSRHHRDTSAVEEDVRRVHELLAPLVALERSVRGTNNVRVPDQVAEALAGLPTDALSSVIEQVTALFQAKSLRSAIAFLVSETTGGTISRFVAPVASSTSDVADVLSEVSTVEESSDDVETIEFRRLPIEVQEEYRERAQNTSSETVRSLLAGHPAALEGAAVQLWADSQAAVLINGRV